MSEPLRDARREKFCQEFVKSLNASQSYVNAGYSSKGADAGASRLLSDVSIRTRVEYLRGQVTAGVVNQEIGNRSARMAAYQDRWEMLKECVAARAKDWKKKGEPIDSRLLRELRGLEQQAAQDMGQWTDAHRLVDSEGKDRTLTLDDLDKLRGSE
jgi:hypothetical protein